MSQQKKRFDPDPLWIDALLAIQLTSPAGHRLVTGLVDRTVSIVGWIVRRRGYNFTRLGLSLRDVACDAVAELLVEDDTGACAPLRRMLAGALDGQRAPVMVEAHLRAILIGTVHQNLSRIFAEFDPVYARMLRMLRIHVHANADITRRLEMAGYAYARSVYDDVHLERQAASAVELRAHIHIPSSLNGSPSVLVLEACLEYLDRQSDFRLAVHESEVMRLTLDLIGADLRSATREEVEQGNHDMGRLLEAVERALEETRAWVTHKYLERGKLSHREAEAILRALRAHVLETAEGEPGSHYHYLRQQLPGLSYDRYRTDYRNTFDYILRRFFSNARALLVPLGYEDPAAGAGVEGGREP